MEIWLCQTCGMVQEHESCPVDSDESSTSDDRYRVTSCEQFEQACEKGSEYEVGSE